MADPVQRVLDEGAARVTRINETTRDRVQSIIATGLAQDQTLLQIADSIEAGGGPAFSEYRGELIARTETMFAYNTAALESYGDGGVLTVQAIDGDHDAECADRDGRTFTVDEAHSIEDHPNGTLDWVPLVGAGLGSAADVRESLEEAGETPEDIAGLLPEVSRSAELEGVADDLVRKATAAEKAVTGDIEDVGRLAGINPNTSFTLEGKEFHTLDARLKTLASTRRKVIGEADAKPWLSPAEIGESMKDNLRYTYIAQGEDYNAAVERASRLLRARGYEPVRATNYWAQERGYAGLNTNWIDYRTGQKFEVQFLTQDGLELKEVASHPLYELQRVLKDGSPRWRELQTQLDDLWTPFREANAGLGNMPFLEDIFATVKEGFRHSDWLATFAKLQKTTSVFSGAEVRAVSEAFEDALQGSTARQVTAKIRDALATIDRTFVDGRLPQMPFVGPLTKVKSTIQGAYKSSAFDGQPIALEFRVKAKMETVFHEITHFIDSHGLGMGGQNFGSKLGFMAARGQLAGRLSLMEQELSYYEGAGAGNAAAAQEIARLQRDIAEFTQRAEAMRPVAEAILNSNGFRNLADAYNSGVIRYVNPYSMSEATMPLGGNARWTQYAMEPEEVFARAMAQYLVKRHGGIAMSELEDALYLRNPGQTALDARGRLTSTPEGPFVLDAQGRRILRPLSDQWEWDDFMQIERAIDELLRNIGWAVS